MNQKTILYSGIIGAALLLAYILFTSSGSNQTGGIGEDSTVNLESKNFRNGREALTYESKEPSLFDNNNGFLDFSGVQGDESIPQNQANYDPAGISPEEREKRRKLVIEKYKELAKQFPKNRYIPREYSEAEKAEIERRDANMNYLQERILSNDSLSPTETAYFYSNKLEETKEKLELINFSVAKLTEAGALSDESKKILDERLSSIQSRNKIYSEELQTAISRGGNPKDFDTKE